MSLLKETVAFKPFKYDWAFEAWEKQQQIHWLPSEVPMADDVKEYHSKLTTEERNLITQIMRFFTQADVEVMGAYLDNHLSKIRNNEVRMMLTTFASMETVHAVAYSHLLDSLGLPEVEYSAFMEYEQMKQKHDFLQKFKSDDIRSTALALGVFGAFVEGLQLFASFAMLMNFPRFGKMKNFGQIISWSIRDESLHVDSITKLFRVFIQENPEVWTEDFREELYTICELMVCHEDAFIDLAFELGPVEGMTSSDIKKYIRWIANKRLEQLNLKPVYKVEKNPLPWLDALINGTEHANFFEARSTEYSKGATRGEWSEVW